MFEKFLSVRALLTLVFGLFTLPILIFGGWELALWTFAHMGNGAYLDHPYMFFGVIFTALGLLSLCSVLYGAWRRSYRGALFVLPVVACLWTLVLIPEITPFDLQSSNHVSRILSDLRRHQLPHHAFPAEESALQAAAANTLTEPSPFILHGQTLNFQVTVLPQAHGPFLTDPGRTPGVVFYAVSADGGTAWLTATDLDKPVHGHVQFKQLNPSADGDPRVITLTGN